MRIFCFTNYKFFLKTFFHIKNNGYVDMEQLSKYRITLPDSKINPDYDKYYEKAKNKLSYALSSRLSRSL